MQTFLFERKLAYTNRWSFPNSCMRWMALDWTNANAIISILFTLGASVESWNSSTHTIAGFRMKMYSKPLTRRLSLYFCCVINGFLLHVLLRLTTIIASAIWFSSQIIRSHSKSRLSREDKGDLDFLGQTKYLKQHCKLVAASQISFPLFILSMIRHANVLQPSTLMSIRPTPSTSIFLHLGSQLHVLNHILSLRYWHSAIVSHITVPLWIIRSYPLAILHFAMCCLGPLPGRGLIRFVDFRVDVSDICH